MADIGHMDIKTCKETLELCPICSSWTDRPERGALVCNKAGHTEMRAVIAADTCTCSPAAKSVLGGNCCSASTARPVNPYDAVLDRIDAELEKINAKGR